MLEIFGRRRVTGTLALLVSAVGLLGITQAAQASGTLSNDGTIVVYTGDGTDNDVEHLFYNTGDQNNYIAEMNRHVTS